MPVASEKLAWSIASSARPERRQRATVHRLWSTAEPPIKVNGGGPPPPVGAPQSRLPAECSRGSEPLSSARFNGRTSGRTTTRPLGARRLTIRRLRRTAAGPVGLGRRRQPCIRLGQPEHRSRVRGLVQLGEHMQQRSVTSLVDLGGHGDTVGRPVARHADDLKVRTVADTDLGPSFRSAPNRRRRRARGFSRLRTPPGVRHGSG